MPDRVLEALVGFAAVVLIVAFIAMVLGVAIDMGQSRLAFDATTACEAKQMLPRRQTFSAHVVCVPAITRQDTATVRITK